MRMFGRLGRPPQVVDAPASRSVTATGGEGPTVSEGDRLVARDATQQRVDTFG